jgi:hypothetical protein
VSWGLAGLSFEALASTHAMPSSWEEQAGLTFTLVCSDCVEWELADLMARYRAGDMRVKVVPASPGSTGGGPPRQ